MTIELLILKQYDEIESKWIIFWNLTIGRLNGQHFKNKSRTTNRHFKKKNQKTYNLSKGRYRMARNPLSWRRHWLRRRLVTTLSIFKRINSFFLSACACASPQLVCEVCPPTRCLGLDTVAHWHCEHPLPHSLYSATPAAGRIPSAICRREQQAFTHSRLTIVLSIAWRRLASSVSSLSAHLVLYKYQALIRRHSLAFWSCHMAYPEGQAWRN